METRQQKEECNKFAVLNLSTAVLALAEIIDQPTDKNGIIRVNYHFAAEKIATAQIAALGAIEAIGELTDELEERQEREGLRPHVSTPAR